jgi:hypothetical protein
VHLREVPEHLTDTLLGNPDVVAHDIDFPGNLDAVGINDNGPGTLETLRPDDPTIGSHNLTVPTK